MNAKANAAGYKVQTHSDGSVDVCVDCHRDLELPTSEKSAITRVSELSGGEYRDPSCFACGNPINGFNRGETDPRPLSEDKQVKRSAIAAVLSNADAIDAFVTVALSDGDTPDETVYRRNDDGEPIAKQVSHPPDASHTIHARVSTYGHDDTSRETMFDRCGRIQKILEVNGIETGVIPADDDDPDWQIVERKF